MDPETKFDRFKSVKRNIVSLSQEGLVKVEYLDSDRQFPPAIVPNVEGIDAAAWAENNRNFLTRMLLKHGVLLFRGFKVKSATEFNQFITGASEPAIEYNERSSPRTGVVDNIYTSTDYPSHLRIFMHNEQSYNLNFPSKIFFHCYKPAVKGGETPIADTRRIFLRIPAEIRERFIPHGYMYVRNFSERMGLPWQEVFQTTDKALVEQYCRKNAIEYEWRGKDRLRTRQIRRAVGIHPKTKEMVWFNHLTFFHITTLELDARKVILERYDEEDYPNNT